MESTNEDKKQLLDASFEDFATQLLPLYSGPQVTIRIGSESHEYKLPKPLLCKQSPYFAAMFEGKFKEGKEQSTILEEIDGVVTPRGFQMLVQWICLGRIVFGQYAPEVHISTVIEFARLADMCGITGMEKCLAEHIKATILANPAPKINKMRAADTNLHLLTSQNIISAFSLPDRHPVRAILAEAVVEGCLRQATFKFEIESSSVPEFSMDLLREVRAALNDVSYHSKEAAVMFKDPLSNLSVQFRHKKKRVFRED